LRSAVAKWGKRNTPIRSTVSELIADHGKWREWLELHKIAIAALAKPGQGGELYGRLFSLDIGKKGIVKRYSAVGASNGRPGWPRLRRFGIPSFMRV
jgi:hypothetical protein